MVLVLRAAAPALALASESAVATTQPALALGSAAGRRPVGSSGGVATTASTTVGGILAASGSIVGRVVDGEPATRARDGES